MNPQILQLLQMLSQGAGGMGGGMTSQSAPISNPQPPSWTPPAGATGQAGYPSSPSGMNPQTGQSPDGSMTSLPGAQSGFGSRLMQAMRQAYSQNNPMSQITGGMAAPAGQPTGQMPAASASQGMTAKIAALGLPPNIQQQIAMILKSNGIN